MKILIMIFHASRSATMNALLSNAASCFRSFLQLIIALGLLSSAVARDKKPDEFGSPSELKPGTTGLLIEPVKGMKYFLKVPRRYDARKGARLIMFLHGSNMNGLDYLKTIDSNRWADEDIICCPNGENGNDPYGQNNFSQVSGPLVAEVTREVQKALKTTVTYIGGHSQGAFLTYNVVLNYPELYQGAFPMAGDCWMQNEPNLWENKPDVLQKLRQIPIAVIHGKADPVVLFSQGEHAYDCFRAMGWTKLRLFAPEKLNHMFGIAPIDEALEWLETVNGNNEKKALSLAKKWAKDGEWGWVRHAVKGTSAAAGVEKAAEDAAAKALPAVLEAMKGNPKKWVPTWVEFWRIHGESAAAKIAVEDYLNKREQERATAAEIFSQSQAAFRSSNENEAYQHLEKLLQTGAHTYQGYFAWKWLSEKK
jgi:predicted esterase